MLTTEKRRLAVTLSLVASIFTQVHGQSRCQAEYDYIVVGSGAGGGPLAGRLALAGYKTLLIEAGPDYNSANVSTPAFYTQASEDANISWDFFTKQFPESTGKRQNVWYPRVGGLGGCTIHNAMIGMYPHVSDFNGIAKELGDDSWSNQNMRKYYNRLKKNHREQSDENVGWASFSYLDILLAIKYPDLQLMTLFKNAITSMLPTPGGDVNRGAAHESFYPNKQPGWHLPPQNIDQENGYVRTSTRDFIKSVARQVPQFLTIWTETLATKVLFDNNNDAIGVEYMKGAYLYKASPRHKENSRKSVQTVYSKREVILAGGAFNTPQLLMLSGIGDPEELKKWHIPIRSALPGVGKNLQDHMEISLNLQMNSPHQLLKGCKFVADPLVDPCYATYINERSGPYTSTGVIFGLNTKTSSTLEEPDVYIFGAVGMFHGYYQGYSVEATNTTDKVSIIMLKAHTNNNNGYVRLRNSDPTDVPDINFLYWSDGNKDIDANAKQLKWMRRQFNGGLINRLFVNQELLPGVEADVEEYVRYNSWGHHACCTAKIGAKNDPSAVLDSELKVYGVNRLRVVDASIFPKIPGFFVTIPIEMVSEKSADMVIAQAKKEVNICAS
ncbi:hypothetical protein K7432_007648 [Basidiobolus ranarum]|uniref:Glucose-methanol-choline oxidoreductase N-terminal domain-containing protein n=1 Tax=Basidiobolus ranarum TaxID=34480 RepID=A0ABR2WT30_9FUNG